jgi:hypothetical protein
MGQDRVHGEAAFMAARCCFWVGRKQFFFEKKNQKTFIPFGNGPIDPVWCASGAKVFWCFFSKKNCFLAFFRGGAACAAIVTRVRL